MGVPAFFRWITDKYPKCVCPVIEDVPPVIEGQIEYSLLDISEPNPNNIEYDNLYIDMNGIIHPCSHPENGEQPKTEEEMYLRLMNYMDRLITAHRPRHLVYLAIDGVAPRAKMNQQRSRRFRAAQETEQRKEVENEAKEYITNILGGESLNNPINNNNDNDMWDSNVITPGTKFMAKLSKYVRYYIRNRLNNIESWKHLKFIFSDASVPGEGEHKIMSFIRAQRTHKDYNPNLKHILHGLDADLIMLGLATHEAHFTISREEVLFGKQKYDKKKSNIVLDANGTGNGILLHNNNKRKRVEYSEHNEEIENTSVLKDVKPLNVLHIHILREYLEIEFNDIKSKLPFKYDFERILDDFVFLCFFVGNDFLPHLPSLDIRDGALDFLILLYKIKLPALAGYLTDSGNIDLKRIKVILTHIGMVEDTIFKMKLNKENRDKLHKLNRQTFKHLDYKTRDSIGAAYVRNEAYPILPKNYNDKQMRQNKNDLNSSISSFSQISDTRNNNINNHGKNYHVESIYNHNNTMNHVDIPNEKNKEYYASLGEKESLKQIVKEKEKEKLDKYANEVQDTVRLGEEGWRDRYYTDKYKSEDIKTGGGRERVFRSYIEGLCWVMKYYYEGCASWQWFYPFHYAPFASDLTNIDKYQGKIVFEKGQPFTPFEQLLGVFPAASRHAIPKCFRWLMVNEDSPIIDFYPKVIPMDPNGKAMPWLWVVLLPFIDEKRLLAAMKPLLHKQTKTEKKRNQRYGKDLLFYHVKSSTGNSLPIDIYTDEIKNKKIELNPSVLSGFLLYSENHFFPISCTVPPPSNNVSVTGSRLDAIPNNQVITAEYQLPPIKPHICKLLDNVKLPEKVLDSNNTIISRPTLGRGNISIVSLAGDFNSIAKIRQGTTYGRVDNNHNHRNTGYDNTTQYLQNGYKNWGSQEPTHISKRQKSIQIRTDNSTMYYNNNQRQSSIYEQQRKQIQNHNYVHTTGYMNTNRNQYQANIYNRYNTNYTKLAPPPSPPVVDRYSVHNNNNDKNLLAKLRGKLHP